MDKKKLAIVIPCFNEQDSLTQNISVLISVLENLVNEKLISKKSFLYFVDDGSNDKTWSIIQEANKKHRNKIYGLKFTRNFGNQSALIAGLENVLKKDADYVMTIDADLQQDESRIRDFVIKANEGVDIVFGVRNDRNTDGFLKKFSSLTFYKFMNLAGVNTIPNHSEYRLMSRRAVELFSLFRERNIFVRGIFSDMGLKTDIVNFDIKERQHGESKFNFISLFKLAAHGITSFSVRPLRLIFYTGIIVSFASFSVGILGAYRHYILGVSTLNLPIFEVVEVFFAGIQILAIGIIGEYIGQILQEVKARPRYLIDEELD